MSNVENRLSIMREMQNEIDKNKEGVVLIEDPNKEENELIGVLARAFGEYIGFLNSTNNLRVEIKNKELYHRIENLSPKQKEKVNALLDIMDEEWY